jgi:hypothetical protein
VEPFVLLAALFALPWGVRVVREQCRQICEQRRPRIASVPPIESVAADLRRLRRQLEARENRPGLSGKGMRMGAVRAAYLQVLGTACQQLDIVPPRNTAQWWTPVAEIYRVEAELRARGLDVREPAALHHAV